MGRKNLAALTSLLLAHALLAPALAQTTPSPQTPAPTRTTTTTPAPQNPQAEPAPPDDEEEDVVRITSNLVQFDAVVYDREDRQITDLRPEEFEVTVGGKRQEITNFSYVSTVSGKAEARPAPAPSKGAPAPPPLPPARLRPEQVRRTVALVVDDLGTSFESIHFVRQGLKKFVDEQMQPGDLVAILRTSAGLGSLQQFTSDKRILYKAIERVRWYGAGRAGVSAFGSIESDPFAAARAEMSAAGGRREEPDAAGPEDYREELFTVGTLGTINFIIRGMDELPGRKSIVVFSDGFRIFRRDAGQLETTRVLEQLRRLADVATRAAVSVYTVDARGLPVIGLTAADNVSGMSQAQVEQSLTDRSAEFRDTQDGLRYMAAATGGSFFGNSNDLTRGIRRALEEQQGYYLIGFRPDSEVFETVRGRTRYNRFEVKIKRAGLKVRTRGGFYGVTDERARPARRTAAEQLMAAITSPFASGDLGLRLTTLFNRGEKDAAVFTSVLHIDVSRFTVADDEGDWKRLVFDVVAYAFGEEGQVVDTLSRTETVKMRGDALRYVMENGLVYRMVFPVKRPGAYQMRVAVRDTATEKVGSASQFVEVPDLRKKRLALSSLLLTSSPPASAPAATPDATAEEHDPLRDAAVRRFRQGQKVDFLYNIYNAKTDKATGRPRLTTQMRIFRDGRQVYESAVRPYDPANQTDLLRLAAGSRVILGNDLVPGEYVLQVAVTDALADRKHAVATQWVDFEIVK